MKLPVTFTQITTTELFLILRSSLNSTGLPMEPTKLHPIALIKDHNSKYRSMWVTLTILWQSINFWSCLSCDIPQFLMRKSSQTQLLNLPKDMALSDLATLIKPWRPFLKWMGSALWGKILKYPLRIVKPRNKLKLRMKRRKTNFCWGKSYMHNFTQA